MHYLRSESTQGGLRMKWVTREKANVDRIECPWLITKFVDPKAEFLFVPREKVLDVAKERGAIPYDSPGAELFHYKQDFFFQAEDGIRDLTVTGVQTCALPI